MTRLFHGLPSRSGGMFVSNITVKWINGFSLNFQYWSAMTQWTIWNILVMMRLLLLIQAPLFFLRVSWLLASLRNNRWWIFMTFSGYRHKDQLFRLFFVSLYSFTRVKLGSTEVCAFWVLLVYLFDWPSPPLSHMYHLTSNESRTLGNKIVDHSDVVGASPVGAAPTTSSFSAKHMAPMVWPKTTARRGEKHSSFGISCDLYQKFYSFTGDKTNACTE